MTPWPGAFADLVQSSLDEGPQGPLAFPRPTRVSTAVRSVAHSASEWLPSSALHLLTTGAKRIRRAAYGARITAEPEKSLASLKPGKRPWSGKRAALLLTHDLDTARCLETLPDILAQEERRGLRSVVLPLTGADYRVDSAWAARIRAAGHDIGLHGLTHDYALGGRSQVAIDKHLDDALTTLKGLDPLFYRAPAFCISEPLAQALVARGFRFDLSRTEGHPRYPSAGTRLPFHPPGFDRSLFELTLSIEDSWLFRDWRLTVDDALAFSVRVLDRVIEEGGLVVIDTHPSILASRESFYDRFLDAALSRDADLLIPCPADLVKLLENRCVA